MNSCIEIAGRKVGPGQPVFVIAEMSANHNRDIEEAVKIIRSAKECGADAVKLQTYTPDTLTIDCDKEYFKVKGTIWEGKSLYDLYGEAYTPWDWYSRLKSVAGEEGVILFSTPFDNSAVNFLEKMEVPAYKIASFELVDIPLIEYVASKGRPIIMSTGMATLEEIEEAVEAARGAGCRELALLKCTSAYPAPPEEMNLRVIPDLAERFGVVAGLSDHTLGTSSAVASVALGASIIEKHFTLSRAVEGVDSSFSLEPSELKAMVGSVREVEKALGSVGYKVTEKEAESRVFRRSLFVVEDIKKGEVFTKEKIRSIRPGYGLPPKYLKEIIGKKAIKDIERGTPLKKEHVS